MVKMAHTQLPKLISKSINTSKMCPTDFSTTLSDVLQSDPVKRLLNQPNIIVKTIPLKIDANASLDYNTFKNNKDSDLSRQMRSELSVILLQTNQDNNREDENLLPSKKQGKSEITLVPIKRERKPCGHFNPCENIVCDVTVQQYVDHEGSSPMLAINIEENEINAVVSKHCIDKKCDALSIDHDRCRRAVVRLNRCDQSMACDICGITLKTQRSRIHHKSCTRKNEYRHNETSSAQILKERMRQREIQMMEASKIKKTDYTDPATSYNLAMERLKNNKELIIIPRSVPRQQRPAVTVTPVPTAQSAAQCNRANNVFGKILPSIPLVLSQQSIILDQVQCSNENSVTTPIKVTLPDALNSSMIRTTNTVPLPQNQYITFTAQSNTHSIPISDFLLPQSQIVTTPIQPKPLLTPVRVVPITNLITQPSLLHQTQGIPKFCIMPDNTVPPLSITNPDSTEQQATATSKDETRHDSKAPQHRKKRSTMWKKRKLKRKDFTCNYCHKSFSTDWYFKIHVAMHTGEKRFPCKICEQSFTNRNDMKRHMSSTHEGESMDSGTCDQHALDGSHKCSHCNLTCTSNEHLRHHHGQKCCRNVSTYKGDVSSNPAETKINSHEPEHDAKKDDNKINGYVCVSNQGIVKNIKTELCYEV